MSFFIEIIRVALLPMSEPDLTGHNYLDPDHAATVPHWSSDNNIIGQIKYSLIQSDGNNSCGDVVFEILNKTFRDQEIFLDQKYINLNMFGIASRRFYFFTT